MGMKIEFKYRGGLPGGRALPTRRMNEIRKQALIAAGEFWHDKYRDLHFTREGAKKYGYTPRSGEGLSGKAFWKSYSGKKQKYLGHQKPLVKSGKSKELAQKRSFKTQTTKGRAILHIRINAPALNFHNPLSKINMRDEMTRITNDELSAMLKVYTEKLAQLIREAKDTAVVTYGGGGSQGGPSGFVGSMSA